MEKTCSNCGFVFSLNYCNNCGQKVIRGRLNFGEISKDFIEQILNLDNRLITTIKLLIINPHIIILEYINGKRKKALSHKVCK